MNSTNGSNAVVITGSVSSIRSIDCDEIWQITRGGPDVGDAARVFAFAPSPALFQEYRNHWRQKDPEEWWGLYVRQFREELHSQEVEIAVEKLHARVESGRTIALVCFCKDSQYCHRSLVAEFLKDRGFIVEEHQSPRPIDSGIAQVTMFV
ncbi:MAG: DUF488 family protein [Firmicutes bacterium]|nr:DUF488 family protein [Bacillota bacterium]MBV1726529.1 DUF488 family protein [Desulforudis sp.]MBV1735527.1 DUF488 family protein [Desulforudis sp.]